MHTLDLRFYTYLLLPISIMFVFALRYMVGIAGVPGSGKSTTAHAVCAKINSMRPRLDKRHVAVVVGMDGELWCPRIVHAFNLASHYMCWAEVLTVGPCMHAGYHYTRAQLDQFPDPDEAHARRGAYWTFDATAFVDKMQELHAKGMFLPCALSTSLLTFAYLSTREQGGLLCVYPRFASSHEKCKSIQTYKLGLDSERLFTNNASGLQIFR